MAITSVGKPTVEYMAILRIIGGESHHRSSRSSRVGKWRMTPTAFAFNWYSASGVVSFKSIISVFLMQIIYSSCFYCCRADPAIAWPGRQVLVKRRSRNDWKEHRRNLAERDVFVSARGKKVKRRGGPFEMCAQGCHTGDCAKQRKGAQTGTSDFESSN